MKITSKSDYAMIMLIELAKQKKGQVLPLSSIADHYNLSLSYLEQLATKLRRAKLIESKQGVKGGYLLAKDSTKITPLEIISAVGDEVYPVPCADGKDHIECKSYHKCNAKKPWSFLGEKICKCLSGVTLKDLSKTNEKK